MHICHTAASNDWNGAARINRAETILLVEIHCPPKVKVQPVLMLSCFVHYSWINEHKDMKLR